MTEMNSAVRRASISTDMGSEKVLSNIICNWRETFTYSERRTGPTQGHHPCYPGQKGHLV